MRNSSFTVHHSAFRSVFLVQSLHELSPLVLLVQLPIPPPGREPVEGNVPLGGGLSEALRPAARA